MTLSTAERLTALNEKSRARKAAAFRAACGWRVERIWPPGTSWSVIEAVLDTDGTTYRVDRPGLPAAFQWRRSLGNEMKYCRVLVELADSSIGSCTCKIPAYSFLSPANLAAEAEKLAIEHTNKHHEKAAKCWQSNY